jgi:5'-3' exonuclease
MTLVIDANNIASASFFKVWSETTSLETAIELFFIRFHRLLKTYQGYDVYLIWDGRNGLKWRREIFPRYKCGKTKSEVVKTQLSNYMVALRLILNSYPVIQISKDDSEADDIIYALCKILNDKIILISGDSDMIQIAQNLNITFINIYNKGYQYANYNHVLLKAIAGDKNDNINGITHYNMKKAIEFIETGIISDEQQKIIDRNKLLIDFEKNPFLQDNILFIKEKVNVDISINTSIIHKHFISLKLSKLVSQWKQIENLLHDFI